MSKQMDKQLARNEYAKNYYLTKLKQKFADEIIKCDLCNCEYSGWALYKHKKGKKHLFRLKSPEEQLDELNAIKLLKKVNKIKKLQLELDAYQTPPILA